MLAEEIIYPARRRQWAVNAVCSTLYVEAYRAKKHRQDHQRVRLPSCPIAHAY